MKTPVLIGAAALMLASAAFAAGPKKAKAKAEVHCAIMSSHTVNVKEATAKHMYEDYKGNRYFFCCGGCPAQFKKDPAKYAKADHIPVPKTK